MSILPFAADETVLINLLQNVHDHLNQELQDLNAQVERKTVQIKGIQSILEDVRNGSSVTSRIALLAESLSPEAEENGSVSNGSVIVGADTAAEADPSLTEESEINRGSDLITAIAEPSPNATPTIADSKPKPAQPSRAKSPDRKSPKLNKSAAKTTTSKSKSVGISDLRPFMVGEYREVPVSAAVGKILAESKQAMSSGDIAAELYEGLSKEDFNRAKLALLTVLSKGKTSGLWQSVGKGLYARK